LIFRSPTTVEDVCEGVSCGQNEVCFKKACICKDGTRTLNSKCVEEDEWCREKCPTKQCSNNRINGKKVCDCDENHKLNPDTGLCELKKFHCGEKDDGRQVCDRKNALCINDWSVKNEYRCNCTVTTTDYDNKCIDFCEKPTNFMECNKKYATCQYDSSSATKFSCECFAGLVRKSSNGFCEMAVYTVRVKMSLRNSEFKDEKKSFYSETLNIKEEIFKENDINFNSKFSALYSEQNELNKKLEIEANKTLIINKIFTELKNSLLDHNFIGISKVNDSICESLDNNFENFNCDLTLQLSKEIDATNVKKMINNKLCKVDNCSIGTKIYLISFSVEEIKVKYFLLFINICYLSPELCSL